MCERDQLLDRQKPLSRILLQRQWLILWMYALERADPFEACQSRFTSDASHSEAIMRTAHLWPIHWTEPAHSTALRAQKKAASFRCRNAVPGAPQSFGGVQLYQDKID